MLRFLLVAATLFPVALARAEPVAAVPLRTALAAMGGALALEDALAESDAHGETHDQINHMLDLTRQVITTLETLHV